jgi:hypothetical protein
MGAICKWGTTGPPKTMRSGRIVVPYKGLNIARRTPAKASVSTVAGSSSPSPAHFQLVRCKQLEILQHQLRHCAAHALKEC